MNSNIMIMTYNSFANRWHNDTDREYVENVRLRGVLVIDEVDKLIEEFAGGQGVLYRIMEERWSVIGLSATPDKLVVPSIACQISLSRSKRMS